MIIDRTLIRSTDPMRLHCGGCGRAMRVCGCATRPEALILHFLSYVPIAQREQLIRYLAVEWGIDPRTTRSTMGYLLRSRKVRRVSHGKYALGERPAAKLPHPAAELTNGLFGQARG